VTRRLIKLILVLLAVAVAAQYLPLNFLRPPVERALQRGLDRQVEIGEVHLDLFGAPGFTLDDVVIHEDPRAGIEPFAYVSSMNARVRWLSLLRRHLEFAYLNLGDATVNLVKTNEGPWNFQFLLDSASGGRASVPAIRMRAGRVNFKFGDIKSVFYFSDADLDVAPSRDGAAEVRFEGSPSQTDRAAQDFGRFFLDGDWDPARTPRLNLKVDLERSSLSEVARMIDPRGFGLHGTVALQAQLSGSPSSLDVSGQLQIDDVHRWDLVPKGGGWKLPFKGALHLPNEAPHGQTLELASDPGAPVVLSFRAWDFLSRTQWEAGLQLNHVPVAELVEVARHMGAALPDELAAEGGASGTLSYNEDGLTGRVQLEDASLTLPDVQPLRTKSAALDIADGAVSMEKSTIEIGDKESAEVQGSYSFLQPGPQIDLRIATRGMNVAGMRSFGVAAIPLLDQTHQGSWRGWARYQGGGTTGGSSGGWSGEYDLLNARIPVEGLADPLRIQSASVKLNGARVSVTKLNARLGDIAFTGDYRWEPTAVHPHKFNIAIEEADIAELSRLLAPSLSRERGFLARTLRLGSPPMPDWLKDRRADGTITIDSLTAGDVTLSVNQARLLWDAGVVRLAGVDATLLSTNLDGASLSGDLEADLSGAAPHYRFDGKLYEVPYKGGKLDFDGSFDADGDGLALLDSLHAEGHLRARSIAFSSDADFPLATACFELQGIRWKFGSVEVTQGGETYFGTGSSQPDGKLVLDLVKGSRAVRFSGPLVAAAP
jgi:AsmA family